jgi:Mn-dependent DtxR family transcriptional regulator
MSSAKTPGFTETQGQYLAFIHTYVLLNRQAPAEADFQRFFCVTAPSVHSMIKQLERLGFIRRTPREARSIELLVPADQLPTLQPIKTSVAGY